MTFCLIFFMKPNQGSWTKIASVSLIDDKVLKKTTPRFLSIIIESLCAYHT